MSTQDFQVLKEAYKNEKKNRLNRRLNLLKQLWNEEKEILVMKLIAIVWVSIVPQILQMVKDRESRYEILYFTLLVVFIIFHNFSEEKR